MIDVVVIGAGPAGTAAAFDLLVKGFSVLLLDKYEFPRKKACAGGITPKALSLFRYDIGALVKRQCRSIKIRPPGKSSFLIQNNNPICHMTQRWELDFFSLQKVLERGGQFQKVKNFSIEEKASHVQIRTSNQLIKARYLIGADGANSRVRRLTDSSCQVVRYPAIEADVEVENPGFHKMEFDFSMPGKGYYWVFPKDNHINIGIYSTTGSPGLKQKQLAEYAKIRFGKNCSGKIRLKAFKGYSLGVGGYTLNPVKKGRALLVGDAAGLAETLLGEGIYFALKSGQAAAQAIANAHGSNTLPGVFYAREIKKIRRELRLYYLSSKCLYSFPSISLNLLSRPFFHKRFAQGYADGKTLGQIISLL